MSEIQGPRRDLIDVNNLLASGESLREQYKRRWMDEKARADRAEARLGALVDELDGIGMWAEERLSGQERREFTAMLIRIVAAHQGAAPDERRQGGS